MIASVGAAAVKRDMLGNLPNEAMAIVEMGYAAFPCQKGKKIPATMHGCKDATNDPNKIEEWWTTWPEANIAIATDWLLVIDVDATGPDGERNPWLDDIMLEYLNEAPQVITPGGGRHFYYRQPEGVRLGNSAGRLSPKVDTRGFGGYVLAPPSQIADRGGRHYMWVPGHELVHPRELPELPDYFVERLVGREFQNLNQFGLREESLVIPEAH